MMKNPLTIMVLTLLTINSYAGGLSNGLNIVFKDNLFIHSGIGGSSLDIDSTLSQNSSFTNGALDKSGKVFEIGVGYKHSKNIFSTLTFQRNNLNIADIDNVYASVNYKFPSQSLNYFTGLLVGYSQLKWSETPHQITINQDLKSTSFMYGLQLGIEKELRDNLSIIMKYQFIKHDHLLDVLNNSSTIEHDSEQNIIFGLQYLF